MMRVCRRSSWSRFTANGRTLVLLEKALKLARFKKGTRHPLADDDANEGRSRVYLEELYVFGDGWWAGYVFRRLVVVVVRRESWILRRIWLVWP